MKSFVVHSILFGLLLASCASQPAGAQTGGEPIFSVAAKNADDQITIQFKDNTSVIEINSPFGIGSATFTLESGVMPERIVARLHLKGLEEFRLISEQAAIAASVSSSEGLKAQSQRKISGNSEQALRSSDALWLDIEIVSNSKKIPLEDGYFEIVFPKEFIQASGDSFEMHWIDFFR